MNDYKIRIPARKKHPVKGSQVVRIPEEAYNALVDIYNESSLSMGQLVSVLVLDAAKRVIFDKED